MNNLLNFKSFLKFLGRNKAYTLIDVFGLSVSLMFVLLIAVYTVQEMSTDKFHTKADRIYLVGNENWMATGAAIPYKIKERYPEVEKVCPVVAGNSSDIVVVSGDRKLKANVMFADSTFFDFFDFRLLQGTREQALAAGNYAVVSSSFARKMFGTDDPMGRKLVVGDTISATIKRGGGGFTSFLYSRSRCDRALGAGSVFELVVGSGSIGECRKYIGFCLGA